MTIVCTKSSLPLVSEGYPEAVIGLIDSELCKIVDAQQAVNRLSDQQQWLVIFLCNLVEPTKIYK